MPHARAPRITLVPRAAQPEVAWRNGGGSTREVLAEPLGARGSDAFFWRISVASVAGDGPFSVFPGIDRTLWLLRGRGMVLDVDGRAVRLEEPWGKIEFAGEAKVHARLLDGPTEDLNVMVDRARATATAEIVALTASTAHARTVAPGEQHVLLVLEGTIWSRADGHDLTLRAGDALLLDDAPAPARWQVGSDRPAVALRGQFARCG